MISGPPQSPDLNPIERIWSCIEKIIKGKRPHIKNAEELNTALKEAWGEIHVDLARRLVDSMKDRCRAVIEAEGGPTIYWSSCFFLALINFANDIVYSDLR